MIPVRPSGPQLDLGQGNPQLTLASNLAFKSQQKCHKFPTRKTHKSYKKSNKSLLGICGILVRFLWDPCGFLVESLWDFWGIWETISFPDNCFPNIVSQAPNCFHSAAVCHFLAWERTSGKQLSGKEIVSQIPPKSHKDPTRIPQGSHKDSTTPPQILQGSLLDLCVFLQKFVEILVELLGNPCWENCFPGPLLSLPHFS